MKDKKLSTFVKDKRFTNLKPLGNGTYGDVYRAFDQKL